MLAAGHTAQRQLAQPTPLVGRRYVGKLLQELEHGALAVFPAPSDRDRVKSVLADLQKTASDFRIIASKGLDLLANGILPRLR